MVKKDGVNFYKQSHLYKMLPQFYQNCFQRQLKKAEYLTRQILVFLLQVHQEVSIELLATVMPSPIAFESRRRALQRFLKLPALNIEKLWFPLIKYFFWTQFNKQKELIVAIDRTQCHDRNIAVLKKVRYALSPMPYPLCPIPYAHEYLIFLRKAIISCRVKYGRL